MIKASIGSTGAVGVVPGGLADGGNWVGVGALFYQDRRGSVETGLVGRRLFGCCSPQDPILWLESGRWRGAAMSCAECVEADRTGDFTRVSVTRRVSCLVACVLTC